MTMRFDVNSFDSFVGNPLDDDVEKGEKGEKGEQSNDTPITTVSITAPSESAIKMKRRVSNNFEPSLLTPGENHSIRNNAVYNKYSLAGAGSQLQSTKSYASRRTWESIYKANFGGNKQDLNKSKVKRSKKDSIRMNAALSLGKGDIKRLGGESKAKVKDASNNLPNLLCLHGWRTNSDISRFHLENLGISDKFNVTYIEGPILSNQPADDEVGILTPGPYYAWAGRDTDQEQEESEEYDIQKIIESLKSLMLHLLLVHESRTDACYDAVFGFSQAVPFISLLSYAPVRKRVLKDMGIVTREDGFEDMTRKLWKFVICACGANVKIFKRVLQHYKLPLEEPAVEINIPSFHVIGIRDQFKLHSEEMMLYYATKESMTCYLDNGHGIPTLTRRLRHIPEEMMEWFYDNVDDSFLSSNHRDIHYDPHSMVEVTYDMQEYASSKPIGKELKDVGFLDMGLHRQYAYNHINLSENNLLQMLKGANPESPALHTPGAPSLTYGDLLNFINGQGDLRRIGANENFTIAYLAPLGPVSAVAFLAITAQCTAAPVDPLGSEEALRLAFDQLNPDVVIAFDGIDTQNLRRAASKSNTRVVYANATPGTCGLYTLQDGSYAATFLHPRLENSADNISLILRTSGTTSAPKICALKMSSIVSNARIIAKNLNLNQDDVALNAMPLFHIGGLSANLLSSLAAGASVILLPQFDAEQFFKTLISKSSRRRIFGSNRALDFPDPTWYSAVPTMHAAVQQYAETSEMQWETSLRFIRSGAAAMPEDLAKRMESTFQVPLILTYSMTEQMPITQPPTGYSIPQNKPNSVGRPVAASLCIVDNKLRILPYPSEGSKQNGEICISGPMVLDEYHANPSANAASYFYLGGMKWFRTGDVGHLDKDGFLFVTGRSKELIKRGGEQVSPHEVEDACYNYEAVEICLVFAVPNPIWGEQVGAALVLKRAHTQKTDSTVRKELYDELCKCGLEQHKFPEKIVVVKKRKLLKTSSSKYIRIGLASHLGITNQHKRKYLKDMKHVSISDGAVGVRFILALAVMYVHIGEFSSGAYIENGESAWSHTRSWCFHTPIFFMVGGFFLAAGTHSPVTESKDLWNFYSLRIASLHPMYLVSILLCLVNFLCRCRPQNYVDEYERVQVPLDGEYFTCQATPVEMPWHLTLFTTLVNYGFALQSWPFTIPFSWFLSSYTWFSSVYIFCIMVFPWCHKQFYEAKDNIRKLWQISIIWLLMLYLYLGAFSMTFLMNIYDEIALQNYWALSTYLLPIGWLPCFALGIALYYMFRHYHPAEKKSSWRWGVLTDCLSCSLLAGWLFYGLTPSSSLLPSMIDGGLDNRFFAAFMSRVVCPIGFLWFWGIAVGEGITARIFSQKIFVSWLAPASYNMFLFHQSISELYYFVTRGKWFAMPKPFYWFSPRPTPVKAWEFPIVILIIVLFSIFMETYVNEWLIRSFSFMLKGVCADSGSSETVEGKTTNAVIISILSKLTYSDMITEETSLSEAGLSSMTTIMLVGELKKYYGGLRLSARDCGGSVMVTELGELIEERMKESKFRPELALTNRTTVFLEQGKKEMDNKGALQ